MKKNHYSLWKILNERGIFTVKNRLKVSKQRIKLPDGKIIDDYYQVYLPESVMVVARTKDKKFVMSKQYLHGLRQVSIVLPGGMVEKRENPLKTAKRELLEETGYSSVKWHLIGRFVPHDNQVCGKVHLFFADDVKWINNPVSKDLEKTKIILMTEKEIISAMKKGGIIAMGTITALTIAKIKLC